MDPMSEQEKPEGSSDTPLRSQDYSEMEDWPGYFRSVLGKDPRETLLVAIDRFELEGIAPGLAIDIAADKTGASVTRFHVAFARTQVADDSRFLTSFMPPSTGD